MSKCFLHSNRESGVPCVPVQWTTCKFASKSWRPAWLQFCCSEVQVYYMGKLFSSTRQHRIIFTAITAWMIVTIKLIIKLFKDKCDTKNDNMKINFTFNIFMCRWMSESARWLIATNKLQRSLKELRRVAHVNGRKSSGDILTIEVSIMVACYDTKKTWVWYIYV